MKLKVLFSAIVVTLLLGGCSAKNDPTTTTQAPETTATETTTTALQVTKIKVAATTTPHAEILEYIKPDLLAKGVDLEIIDVPDYNMPNRALSDKEVDANFFQHMPYLNQQVADFGYKIESLVGVHIEPMGFYSKKIKSLDELKEGATISIPNDPSNEARALVILNDNGIIKLDDPKNEKATVLNIVDNPKKIKFQEVDAAMLSRTLDDVDGSIINSNYALEAKLNPIKDAIVIEATDGNPYVNIIAIRTGDAERPELQTLKEVITSDKVKQFILDKYAGACIPAF